MIKVGVPDPESWVAGKVRDLRKQIDALRTALTGDLNIASLTSTGIRVKTITNSPVALSIDATGQLGIAASTLAKKNVDSDYKVDMSKFLSIVLKNWSYKADPTSTGMGPIANDLDAAGLTEFVIYNLDGSIQGVRTDMLLVGLWSAYVQSRATTLARIAKQLHQTVTVPSMTALALGGTKSYTVSWPTPFADTDYFVNASVFTSAGVPVTGISASCLPSDRNEKSCTVQVSAGVSLLANQTLVVEGLHV